MVKKAKKLEKTLTKFIETFSKMNLTLNETAEVLKEFTRHKPLKK